MTPEQYNDFDRRLGNIEESIKNIETRLFTGNGTPAVLTRIDRLEQRQSARQKHFWVLYAAITAALLAAGGDWVKSHFSNETTTTTIYEERP